MIIESKFRDYYDPIAFKFNDDKSIVYKRHQEYAMGNIPVKLPININYIIFCGKLYPYIPSQRKKRVYRSSPRI